MVGIGSARRGIKVCTLGAQSRCDRSFKENPSRVNIFRTYSFASRCGVVCKAHFVIHTGAFFKAAKRISAKLVLNELTSLAVAWI